MVVCFTILDVFLFLFLSLILIHWCSLFNTGSTLSSSLTELCAASWSAFLGSPLEDATFFPPFPHPCPTPTARRSLGKQTDTAACPQGHCADLGRIEGTKIPRQGACGESKPDPSWTQGLVVLPCTMLLWHHQWDDISVQEPQAWYSSWGQSQQHWHHQKSRQHRCKDRHGMCLHLGARMGEARYELCPGTVSKIMADRPQTAFSGVSAQCFEIFMYVSGRTSPHSS